MEQVKRKMIYLSFIMMFIVVAAILFYTVFVAGDSTITDATLVKNSFSVGPIYEYGCLYKL